MPSSGKKRCVSLLQLFRLLMRFRVGIFRLIVTGHEDNGKEQEQGELFDDGFLRLSDS